MAKIKFFRYTLGVPEEFQNYSHIPVTRVSFMDLVDMRTFYDHTQLDAGPYIRHIECCLDS